MSEKINKINNPFPKTKVNITHHSNGKVKSKTYYVNDKRHGAQIGWYENGVKWREQMWRDGKKHGVETYWRDNGTKGWVEMWRDGERHGVATGWHENGLKRGEECFVNNAPYAGIEWNKEGNATRAYSLIPASPVEANLVPKLKNHI